MAALNAGTASTPDSDDVPIHQLVGGAIAGDGAGGGGAPAASAGSSGENTGVLADPIRPW